MPHFYYSDRAQQDVPIYSDDADPMVEGWRSRIRIPELTFISR